MLLYVPLGVLFKEIKVSAQCTDSEPMVTARSVSEPPPGWLQVNSQAGEERGGTSDHLGVRSASRKLRKIREFGALGEGDLDRIRHVGARPGTNAGAPDERQLLARRDGHTPVAVMVALPMTLVPS